MDKINQLKHFDALDYEGEYFTNELKDGEVGRKYKTDTDKMTASDYTHLFGYLNPYYRAAYSIPKRKR